jgi:dolichol-phosphate mannosyltransferase
LDADFSHDPAAIPALLAAHAPGRMVIGSRYCPGGSCDYTGYRAWVSRLGNAVARRALGLPLRELTTYFRVIDVATLHHLPLHRLDAEGYGYGVQLIQALHRAGVALVEVPIRFADRTRGASKIPKLQILWSALGLARLALERLAPRRAAPVGWTEAACQGCGDHALVARRGPRVARRLQGSSAAPSHHCLRCGLRQTPPAPSCPPQRPDR